MKLFSQPSQRGLWKGRGVAGKWRPEPAVGSEHAQKGLGGWGGK